MSTPLLIASQPIVDENGLMDQAFRQRMIELTQLIPIIREGNPEGVVEAPQYSTYIDSTDPLVPVTYRKMVAQISNDRKKGWIAG